MKMTREQAIKILIEYQEWRSGLGKYDLDESLQFPYENKDLNEAINFAIKYLYEKVDNV